MTFVQYPVSPGERRNLEQAYGDYMSVGGGWRGPEINEALNAGKQLDQKIKRSHMIAVVLSNNEQDLDEEIDEGGGKSREVLTA